MQSKINLRTTPLNFFSYYNFSRAKNEIDSHVDDR